MNKLHKAINAVKKKIKKWKNRNTVSVLPIAVPKEGPHIDKYSITTTIGSGSFSCVKLATSEDKRYAIKLIRRSAIVESSRLKLTLQREIELLQIIDHPHLVKYVDVVEDERNLGIVMEYIPGGELFQYVSDRQRLSERETRIVMMQLIEAVEYLHSMNIVHRDLKLENIIVDARHSSLFVKLIDFGLAREFKEPSLRTRCGSEEYAAPEIIKGDAYDGRKSDIWSLGIILYACLFGTLPFNPDPNRPKALYDKICNVNFRIIPGIVSSEARDLITRILVSDPEHRISLNEIRAHSWFN